MFVTIIPEDKAVVIDGLTVVFDDDDFGLDPDIHAIQWDGAEGHIEYKEINRDNEPISDFSQFEFLITKHREFVAQYEAEKAAYENSWDRIRAERDALLFGSDWTQLPDIALPNAKRAEWAAYRQALRDITETYAYVAEVVWPTPPQ